MLLLWALVKDVRTLSESNDEGFHDFIEKIRGVVELAEQTGISDAA